jgi:hypothetical protein
MMTREAITEALERIKCAQAYLVQHLLEHGHTEHTDAAMRELGYAVKTFEPQGEECSTRSGC